MLTFTSDPCSQLQGALHSREREIASLRKQLDSSQEELAELKLDKEISVKDNTRLQDDLTTMTRENQVSNRLQSDSVRTSVSSRSSVLSRLPRCYDLIGAPPVLCLCPGCTCRYGTSFA